MLIFNILLKKKKLNFKIAAIRPESGRRLDRPNAHNPVNEQGLYHHFLAEPQ
jgi:hypothetical protein